MYRLRIGKWVSGFLSIQFFFLAVLLAFPVDMQWEEIPVAPQDVIIKLLFLEGRGWLAIWRGAGGILLCTDDGGNNWRELEMCPKGILDFHFINTREGWVTDWRELWHTLDGGETWKLVPAELDLEGVPWGWQYDEQGVPNSVYFFDSNDGIGILRSSHALGDYSWIIVTTQDGGEHWRARKWEQYTSNIAFSEIVGDRVWIGNWAGNRFSFDRGKSWENSTTPGFESLSFLNPNDGWSFVTADPRRLFRTEDGGRSWQLVSKLSSLHTWRADLLFVSDREGWLLTFLFKDYLAHHIVLWHTQDGGERWQQVELPVDSKTRSIWSRGLPVGWSGRVGELVLDEKRGDLWIAIYDAGNDFTFSHRLFRGRGIYTTSINPSGKCATKWGKLKYTSVGIE